ncbi:uncharacterized protein LOC127723104 isoform X46 [Mytilus californianus]|uniref:uncharacterized protein LOC127723104 isoform X46 n=1 Tax=Mytilus californianus TaxID=6549 RepID=UPI0022482F5E|nr:uncharacterized protein LOC127723104 isoform X46 [Mytilus californianus]
MPESPEENLDDNMKTRLVCSAPILECLSLPSSRSSSTTSQSIQGGSKNGDEEKEERNEEKTDEGAINYSDPTPSWRESIRQQMEEELEQRVREALETPPLERAKKTDINRQDRKSSQTLNELNSHIVFGLAGTNRDVLKSRKWRALQAKRQVQRLMRMNYIQPTPPVDYVFQDTLSRSNQADFPGVFGLSSLSEGVKDLRQSFDKYPSLTQIQRQFYTKHGFLANLNGQGNNFRNENGKYKDRYGVERDQDGPFWPSDCGPLFATPRFQWFNDLPPEPLFFHVHNLQYPKTFDNQVTHFTSKWRGVLIVYDSERSSRDRQPQPVPDGCCPNLVFESRFESGNLRQARRVGQFEYELVLKTDLYTNRHTQWYYFRVSNTVPGVVYKFRIVNLLKRDSLYNYGMRPLQYSEKEAKLLGRGWMRAGHHISYSRNVMHLHCPLLTRGIAYYMLEWQMDFPHEDDACYLAHCYPYTFTDLKEDLDSLINAPDRKECMKREVLCETRAGNSCFLVTVSNFGASKEEQHKKKFVVVTARVHPGETQASWMMKGLLEFITSSDPVAKELRNRFIFKIVPMLNPDGVIVGNYRCSLAARDLNRNYRHPRKESFPTVWHTKTLIEKILERHEILLYCDLHGHSRKHNVFMYGNNTSEEDVNGLGAAKSFLNERLFPWLMSQKAPDKFAFKSCKFNIKRCKESTGRVVMWRQMKILNSFTLEATFSGTIMNKNEYRHFNVHDFQEMGKVLSQTVLEYQKTQENNAKQSEMVLELTRYVTQQVMEQRGLMERPKLPNFRSMMKGDKNVINNTDTGNDSSQEKTTPELHVSTPVFKEAVLTVMDHENNTFVMEEKRGKRSKKSEKAQSNLSRKDVDNLLENASLKTMDGCLKILAQLNVREVMQESDSSDSDSESEPEMKIMETKSKKKKRKSRKQRDKEQADRKNGSGSSDKKQEEVRSKSLTALPNIPACSELSDRDKGDKSLPKQVFRGALVLERAKTTTSFEKFMRSQKKDAHFVSKYEGRRNGGIPCFAEERSIERAQKRMADMKKRTEEDKQREMAFFVALHEGSANIAQTLVGLNVRTAYTHADAFRDMNSTMPSLPLPRDISTDDGSGESEADFTSATLSLAARNNPYVHQDSVQLQMLPLDVTSKKSYRSGPITRTSRRQSTPSITFNNTPPNIFSVTDEIKTEKRPRITPNAGPLQTIYGEEAVPKNGIAEEAIQRLITKNGEGDPQNKSAAIAREYMNVLLDRLKKRAKTVLYDPDLLSDVTKKYITCLVLGDGKT